MLVYKFPYRIGPKGEIIIPSQSGTLTYDTSSQSPTWSNYDSTKMTLTGDTSGINAGTYTAIFTLDSHYIWTDGTSGAKNVNWQINKAPGNITLSKNSVTLTPSNPSDTVTFSNNTGTVSVSSADTSVATASVSGNTITIQRSGGVPASDIITANKIINDSDPIIIYDENSTWKGSPIEWQVIGINQDGQNTITLQTDKVLTGFAWDTKNTSGVSGRQNNGANRVDSLLHQWLNSDETNWYSSQHSNQAPSNSTVENYTSYGMNSAATKGFMINLSDNFKSKLVTVTKNIVPCKSGDPSSFTGKLFCPSVREVDPNYTSDYYIPESNAFTYQHFQNNSQSRRIKSAISPANAHWWLRSPDAVNADDEWYINSNGGFFGANVLACSSVVGASPACVLPSDIILEEDANGKYKIVS